MAGWYIRRDEKIVGPVELSKLQELVADGRLLPTDQLAKEMVGPWKDAGQTTLFASSASDATPLVNTQPPGSSSSSIITTSQNLPATIEEPPAGTHKSLQVARIVLGGMGRGMLATWGAVSRTLATRAQRKHELKLAKIQAEALAKAQRPPEPQPPVRPPAPQQPPPPPQVVIVQPPPVRQTTVVHVMNRNIHADYGCSGCGLILLVLLLAGVAYYVVIVLNTQ